MEISSGPALACLALWNGASNDAPPSGWYLPSYDDSGWPFASGAQIAPGNTIPGGSAAIWSDNLPRSSTDEVLLRAHFDLPGDLIAASIVLVYDDAISAIYLNGVLLSVHGQASNVGDPEAIPVGAFVAGGHNVLAIHAINASPGALNYAFVAYTLSITSTDDTQTTSGAGVATTGSYGSHLGAAVRLKHASGVVDWEHDGTLWRVRSGDKTVLQAPFPTMSGQPAALLGRDPQTGLPMWTGGTSAPAPPPPPPVSHTYGHPDRSLEDTGGAPDPLPVPPSAQRVCGAADGMTALAALIYDAIVQVINKAKSNIINAFTQGLKNEIMAELVSLLTEAEFAGWVIDAIQLALIILTEIVEILINWGTSLPLIWPPDNPIHTVSQQYLFMRCAAWQALWLTGGDYLSRSQSADGLGTKDYWIGALAPQWSFFAGSTQSGINQSNPPWQLVWINAIIDRVSDGGWALSASVGAQHPSSDCSGCPGYPP